MSYKNSGMIGTAKSIENLFVTICFQFSLLEKLQLSVDRRTNYGVSG
jgi:hypothetical protein